MPKTTMTETRDEVMTAGSLMEFFCHCMADDFRMRARQEVPGLPWIGLAVNLFLAVVFWSVGQTGLSRLFFGLLILQIFWTIWVLVVRSGSQVRQQADDVARGNFPPETAPLVSARLRWWNHLISPRRWARHSRIHGRRGKLVKRIAEINERLAELEKASDARPPPRPPVLPVHLRNRFAIEERLQSAQRNTEEIPRLMEELQVYETLLEQVTEVSEKLERIAALEITVREGAQIDLNQMVADAMAVLEERRTLVQVVDAIDPEEFVNMITV